MESDLISRSALLEALRNSHGYHARSSRDASLLARDIRIVNEVPAVDAVEVVRCKDCGFHFAYPASPGRPVGLSCENEEAPWHTTEYAVFVKEIDFCSYGRRREGAD